MRFFIFTVVFLIFSPCAMASTAYEQCRNHFLHGQYFLAEKSCLLAAEEGSCDAQKWLAFMYSKGKGVKQDYGKAVIWLKKSAKSGDANSQYHLGRFFQFGNGVKQDYKTARHWYEESARQGDGNGLYALANVYRKGLGVDVNIPLAYAFYNLSAEAGLVLAEQQVDLLSGELTAEEKKAAKKLAAEFIGGH